MTNKKLLSLKNIHESEKFLDTIFRTYITSLKNVLSSDIPDDKLLQYYSITNKYQNILSNFSRLLLLYNKADYYISAGTCHIIYFNDNPTIRETCNIELYDNPYLPSEEYIIVISVASWQNRIKHFPGYTNRYFEGDSCIIYDKKTVEAILNCYTYEQFMANVCDKLLPDLWRIIYSYTIA